MRKLNESFPPVRTLTRDCFRRCTPRNDKHLRCHCEQSEAISTRARSAGTTDPLTLSYHVQHRAALQWALCFRAKDWGLTAYFSFVSYAVRRSRGAMVVGDVLRFRRPRGNRSYRRPERWRAPRASTLRPFLLWGVLVILFMTSWLQGEIVPGDGHFALCSRWNQQRCVIDGDTIRYNGLTIRFEDIDAPETHEPRCASELALGERATNRLIELINAGPFEVVYGSGRKYGPLRTQAPRDRTRRTLL